MYSLYGEEYNHLVENDICSDALPGYTIKITYPAKLKSTLSKLLEEFDRNWHVLNKSLLKFKDTKPESNITKRCWIKILEEYSINFSNVAELILIVLWISPGTGLPERSYSKLTKTCYKDRAHISAETLEILYLLYTLQIKNDDDELFSKVRDYL